MSAPRRATTNTMLVLSWGWACIATFDRWNIDQGIRGLVTRLLSWSDPGGGSIPERLVGLPRPQVPLLSQLNS